jgi:hypothetical protein
MIELYTIPKVVMKMSQSVARFESINLKAYNPIMTIAKIPPRRRVGSKITLIIFYPRIFNHE